ncbi:MAG: class I SAM-dependent methyltransferase [Actinomycetaceae bacterium]|nr:class I SAM-dependent methyltransferase [Actinomycetaceae bacterium]
MSSAENTQHSLDKSSEKIAAMFDGVAKRYDIINDLSSLFQSRLWRIAARQAVHARAGETVLDVAAGTGTSSLQYAKDGAIVTACDISEGMLKVGRQRYPELNFVYGDATNLPFEDNTFDVVTISYGLRNVSDPDKALREFFRVTKRGGRLVINEFSTPVFPPFRAIYHWYLGTVLPRIAQMMGNKAESYSYLMESIIDWPDQKRLGYIIRRAGWDGIRYKNLSNGIVALHCAVKTFE